MSNKINKANSKSMNVGPYRGRPSMDPTTIPTRFNSALTPVKMPEEPTQTYRKAQQDPITKSCSLHGRQYNASKGGCPSCAINRSTMCKSCNSEMYRDQGGIFKCMESKCLHKAEIESSSETNPMEDAPMADSSMQRGVSKF